MIGAFLAFVILIGLGYILGYLRKQDDAYERGYFFGRADGRTEVFNLFKEEKKNNGDNDSEINGSSGNR